MNSFFKRYCIKSIMFISSYFPLYLMLLILHQDYYDTCDKIKNMKVAIFVGCMVLFIIISVLSVILLVVSTGKKPLKFNELERPDDTVISYMMTYIIPLLTANLLDKGEVFVNIVLFLLIGYLYIRLNLLYLNPLWSMFGYLSYRVNSDVVVVTNLKYIELKQLRLNDVSLKGFYITNDIFVAQRKDNKPI